MRELDLTDNACSDSHLDPVTPIQDGLTILAFFLVFVFPWIYGFVGLIFEVMS